MVAAIIQARMGSTRLPGKVLEDLNGKPLLANIIERLKECSTVDDIIVATTVSQVDDELARWCTCNDIKCYRGDELNVLKRYYDAATYIKADVVVRITADDPFKDPRVIDSVVKQMGWRWKRCSGGVVLLCPYGKSGVIWKSFLPDLPDCWRGICRGVIWMRRRRGSFLAVRKSLEVKWNVQGGG